MNTTENRCELMFSGRQVFPAPSVASVVLLYLQTLYTLQYIKPIVPLCSGLFFHGLQSSSFGWCSMPIYPLQRVFYPQNRPCTPKSVGTFYMQGYKVKEKTAIVPHCTPSFKTQWAPCGGYTGLTKCPPYQRDLNVCIIF